MKFEDLEPGVLVQDGPRTLLVSSVYDDVKPPMATAEVVYPVPANASVLAYTKAEVQTRWHPVTDAQYRRYCKAWGRLPVKPRPRRKKVT